ncbi:MAG TPA: hypothetical protein VLK28_00700 [Methylomirabilota bacterium]|nr:hypothetical protein [Methylomirabilota bacterium]
MAIFSLDALVTLTASVPSPAVSIYLPTHRAVPETLQDPIRFKNLLRAAEERVLAAGARASEARSLLAPAVDLLGDSHFWTHQRDGLAVFAAPGVFRRYRVPIRLDETLVVSHRFHVKPLVPLATGDSGFFLLTLSQNQVRLFEGSRGALAELELEAVPPSLAEALKYDDPQKQLQYHTGAPGRAAMFHGQGTGIDEHKDNLLRFFRKVDAGLHELLRGRRAPLVLAGVEYLFPIYREANRYPHLLDEGIAGNPERVSIPALHAQAWSLLEPRFTRAQEDAVARYRQLAGTGKTSTDVTRIVPATLHGRVEVLFAARTAQQWGTYDPAADRVHLGSEAQPGREDLLDLAVVQALIRGATVHIAEPARMPEPAPVAAIFRY